MTQLLMTQFYNRALDYQIHSNTVFRLTGLNKKKSNQIESIREQTRWRQQTIDF